MPHSTTLLPDGPLSTSPHRAQPDLALLGECCERSLPPNLRLDAGSVGLECEKERCLFRQNQLRARRRRTTTLAAGHSASRGLRSITCRPGRRAGGLPGGCLPGTRPLEIGRAVYVLRHSLALRLFQYSRPAPGGAHASTPRADHSLTHSLAAESAGIVTPVPSPSWRAVCGLHGR
jgi:hypothetical protein